MKKIIVIIATLFLTGTLMAQVTYGTRNGKVVMMQNGRVVKNTGKSVQQTWPSSNSTRNTSNTNRQVGHPQPPQTK